jgi:NTE family protein/lysophospholipid hydrolase
MPADDLIRLLAGFPLLSTLAPETAEPISRRLRPREIRCGEALIRQGEPGDSLFLVVDGRFEARIEQPAPLPPRVLGVMGRGETVGEMAVITAEPRSCSVVATRRSSVLELSGEDFRRVLEQHPAELLTLTRWIVQRSTRPSVSSPVRTVALLPLDADTDVTWLARGLSDALSRFGKTLRLGRALAISQLGEVSAGATVPRLSTQFLEWLAQKERAHDFIVYEAIPRPGEWTHRCLAQADLVLLVGRAEGSPDLTVLEREMLGPDSAVTLAPLHLVLVRPSRDRRPAGTGRWLEARQVALHHHVALGDRGDVERLARIISGRAIELVLSGGGARGFAEIGVIRALEEAGLPVDLVGGASMGATIGALRAMEWDAARIQEVCRRTVTGKGSLTDLTFPFVALFAARRAAKAVQEMCDGRDIEDCPIGYFAVSTDLCRAEEVVHRRGPLWMAMRMSAGFPGAVPPVITGDRCLVDGGVLNNLPIDVMARLSPGRIVAVDVSRQSALDLEAARTLGASPDLSTSGWRLLFRRLNPFRRREAPRLHIGDVLARASEVASVRIARTIQEQTPIALRIEPPVDGYRLLDFGAIDPIVDAGYRFALEHVDEWKRLLLPDAERRPERSVDAETPALI